MTDVTIQSKVNGRLETKYDVAIDQLFSIKESLELLSSGNTNYTGVKGSKSLKLQLQEISSKLDKFQQPDNIEKEQKKRLTNAVKSLEFDIQSKMECLKSLQAIDSLEDHCCTYSNTLDQCAADVVSGEEIPEDLSENITGFISPASQNCISANRETWKWIKTLHDCTTVHLSNASDYQQYFHEIAVCSPLLKSDLSRLHNSFQLHHLRGDLKDAHKLLRELHDITIALRQWESRTDDFWSRSNQLTPVNLRTDRLEEGDSPLTARAMCNYRTKESNIREQENILIVDNLQTNEWKVKTCEGKTTSMPSAAILIPGPCHSAIQEAIKLRLKLLAEWTDTLKKVGHRLICFLLLVFKSDYDDVKVKTMTSIDLEDRDQLKDIMNYLEETLAVHWTDHEGFGALQERLLIVRMILDNKKNAVNFSTKHKSHNQLVIQGQILEKLMQKYKELWCWWDAYKVGLESSQSPDMMLILEKWQELKFVKPEDFAAYWKSRLCLSDEERTLCGLRILATPTSRDLGEPIDETDMKDALNGMLGLKNGIQMASYGEDDGEEEELLESIDEDDLDRANSDTAEGGKFGYASERKMANTEQLSSAAMEEKKTFTIRSIVDTSTGKDISLQEATDRGIMIPTEGLYYNVKKDERIPIPVAMNQGLIRVEFTSTKRTAEKKSSVGIITIKTIQEYIRPYKVISAKNTETGKTLSLTEAVDQKIIDEANGMFFDLKTNTNSTIIEASEENLVEIEYINEDQEDISTSQMFAVRAVMDVARHTTLTFAEAMKQGIIDKISGTFRNTLTYEKITMADAIMKGFLKAKPIEDASMIEIDPENEMTIHA